MDDAGHALELALLAAPLPGDAPAGVDLRQDFSPQSLYYRLRDARSEARALERRADQGDPDVEAGVPTQWRTVRELAVKALAEHTKDLEIAAWLTEAMVRFNDLAGLASGASLIAELAATFWDGGLYPLPDEDGMETRVAPIAGLNGQGGDGTLMQPLRRCVLFATADGAPVTFYQYTQSEDLEKITDAKFRKQRLEAGVVALEDLARTARLEGKASGAAHFARLRTAARDASAAWAKVGAVLDERAGRASPSTGQVRALLSDIFDVAQRYAPPEQDEPPEASADEGPAQRDAGSAVEGPAAQPVRAVTREDMLRELGRIAEYFRRTEPHSPLAYTLEEAVRRGRLTWPELLEEVVPDGGARGAILSMLGIRPPTPDQ